MGGVGGFGDGGCLSKSEKPTRTTQNEHCKPESSNLRPCALRDAGDCRWRRSDDTWPELLSLAHVDLRLCGAVVPLKIRNRKL